MAEHDDRMLRCIGCDKPVLLMTPAQAARAAEHPGDYEFVCLECSGDSHADEYGDAGG